MNILITGGAGFIGSWLVEDLLTDGHRVVVLDNLSQQIHGSTTASELTWLHDRDGLTFVQADIRDAAAMDGVLANAEVLVHLAAETGTGQSMYQVAHYYEVNQQATAAIFEAIALRHRHLRKVILASSRSIYGEGAYLSGDRAIVPPSRDIARMKAGEFEPLGPAGEPLTLIATPEDISPSPASIYAATKVANEALGRVMAEAYGITVMALRFQNVYGPRQSLKNPYTGILSIFSNRMRQHLPINIYEDGKESRDFVHVRDVVRAIGLAIQSELSGFNAINIGSGIATTVQQIASLLKQAYGSDSTLNVTGDFRSGDIRHCYADLTRAQDLLKFSPAVSLDAGIREFCDWVLTQPLLEDRSAAAQHELSSAGLGSFSTITS